MKKRKICAQAPQGLANFEAKGRGYRVAALTLRDLKSVMAGFDEKDAGGGMVAKLVVPKSRETVAGYVERYLRCDGEAMSLEKCLEHGWDVEDLGRFMQVLYRLNEGGL